MKAPKVKRITVSDYLRNPTPEKYERMVERVAVVLYEQQMTPCRWARIPYSDQVPWLRLAQDALRAIGITPRTGRRRKGTP